MKKCLLICFGVPLFLMRIASVEAQTTLVGDHLINGNLTVGNSVSHNDVAVTGSISVGSAIASGLNSFALGDGSHALSVGSSALGNSFAYGDYSFAAGASGAGGGYSFAAATGSVSEGWRCAAFALGEAASGENLTGFSEGLVMGGIDNVAFSYGCAFFTDASYSCSTAFSGGYVFNASYAVAFSHGYAEGDYSVAAGEGTYAQARNSFVVGRNNAPEGNVAEWVNEDPLFVIGNGTGNSSDPPEVQYRNAFTVYKNGEVKMVRQGDILMGEFGNPE